jgi:hypothetical protein
MKILNQILHPVKKFSKGMLALLTLNLLVVLCIFIFDSCKKAAYESSESNKSNDKFLAALETNKKKIGNIAFSRTKRTNTTARAVAPDPDEITVYVQFPNEATQENEVLFQNTNSLQDLADLIHETNAVVHFDTTITNINYPINLPIETIENSLNPLIQEAKQYLYSKGFTEQAIQQMIEEENASEVDLVPLVISLVEIENSQSFVKSYYNYLPITSAHAKEVVKDWAPVGECALKAVGADVLYALYQSTAKVWTMAAIKTAFKTVASKVIGPVGVAIAVIEFGWCIWNNRDEIFD